MLSIPTPLNQKPISEHNFFIRNLYTTGKEVMNDVKKVDILH